MMMKKEEVKRVRKTRIKMVITKIINKVNLKANKSSKTKRWKIKYLNILK